MRKLIKKIINGRTKPSSAFSSFFVESSAKEKKRVIRETVRASNEEQRNLIERYEKKIAKSYTSS